LKVCDDNHPQDVKVVYNGGVTQSAWDTVIVCKQCLEKYPFNKQIKSTEFIINKKMKFSAENSDKNNRPTKEGVLN